MAVPHHADELYQLIENNREFLAQWLPWLDDIQAPADTRAYINSELARFAHGEALYTILLVHDRIAGAVAFKSVDHQTRTGVIGYWLAEEVTGLGIMTQAVAELLRLGRQYYNLRRFVIRCGVANVKSRAIPERLGFRQVRTVPKAEFLNRRWLEHLEYELNLK